jgi:hypothetical protein
MQEFYDALLVICDNYQAMQQEHLRCLAAEVPPDMEQLVFERSQRGADLQNHLTALVYRLRLATPEAGWLDGLRARLTTLLQDDAMLAARLQAHRATLTQRRAEMQQGQRALVGYGSLVTPLSPRCVDISG